MVHSRSGLEHGQPTIFPRQQISTLSVSGISRFFKQVGAPDLRKPPDSYKELNDAGEAMTDLVGPSEWD